MNDYQFRYLCIHCGSGPKMDEAIGKLNYTQGDKCPACGKGNPADPSSSPMRQVHGRIYQCQDCGHRIELPRNEYLTGPRAAMRRTERQL